MSDRNEDLRRDAFARFLFQDGYPEDEIAAAVRMVIDGRAHGDSVRKYRDAQAAYVRWQSGGFPGVG